MNDTDITARLRESLRRNADRAPNAAGLAEVVRRRAKSRGIRRWILGVVSGALAVAAAFLLPSVVAQPSFGEVLGSHRVEVCVDGDGVGTPELWVVDRAGDGTVETENSLDNRPASVDLKVVESDYEVNVGVHPPTDDASALEQARELTVDGHVGRIGVSERTGSTVARIGSGIEDYTIVVAAAEGRVSVAELADWLKTFDIHNTTAPCEENA